MACAVATGQPADQTPPAVKQPIDTLELTGRDFGGLRLASPVNPGKLEFAAARVWTWQETAAGQTVTRLFLSGDAQVTLGVHSFSAARAVVWLSPLPQGDPDAGPGVYQVFVYFDRVATPTADAAVAVSGDRLAVQGVFRSIGPVSLRADYPTEGRPDDRFIREGERELAVSLRRLVTGELPPLEPILPAGPSDAALPRPPRPTPLRPGVSRPYEPPIEAQLAEKAADVQGNLLPAPRSEPIMAKDGILSFASGDIHAMTGPEENTLVITGGVTMMYWSRSPDRTVQITAERAVAFLEPGPLSELAQFDVAKVRGVYLEGDVVADDGRYRIRAPKIYYSIQENRAYIIDAVFWTTTSKGGLPLYVRAKSIEQESRDRWTARSARLTNTAFFDPLLTLGVSTVTIERESGAESGPRTIVDAHDITLRAQGVPFFYFPRFRGDPTALPIKGLGVGNSSRTGGVVTTTWDLYGLLGLEPDKGVSAELLLDQYFDRGPGVGVNAKWKLPTSEGAFFAYTLPDDTGRDLTSAGTRIGRDGEFRGLALFEHTAQLDDHWSLQLQGAYVSDENFVGALFNELARSRREFENSAYLKRQDENTVLTAEVKGTFNDFTPNEYLLQTPGYTVQRTPEVAYTRLADDLLPDSAPGVLTYTSEYRLGRLALNFTDPTAAQLGFTRLGLSTRAFGLTPNQSIADALRAAGYSEGWVTRFDTRHELDAQFAAGPVNVNPFLVGRLTAWDRDFARFSPDADERERLWGAAGVRIGTEFHRVDNAVESRLFDLHRVRHIVAPSVTVWTAGTTIDRADLPVYDEGVESIAEGTAVRLAVDQVWQTQRGGPGRWRSVDVFSLSTELVLSSDDVDKESPIGRYFDYRPELSNLGNYGTVDAVWQVSEAVALGANSIYDFDLRQQARTSLGGTIQHTPEFSTFADIRYINSQNQTYVNFGVQYQLTPKYAFNGTITYDTERGDVQAVSGQLRREFPNVVMGVTATYNDITGETSFGFVFQPLGVAQSQAATFQDRSGGSTRGRSLLGG
jgi:hypothetical protein